MRRSLHATIARRGLRTSRGAALHRRLRASPPRTVTATASVLASSLRDARTITTTRPMLQPPKKSTGGAAVTKDENEVMLMQQMLDAMGLDAEEDEEMHGVGTAATPVALESNLPVTGVVLNIKNCIASISGLRHATIGSVVGIYNTSDGSSDSETGDASGDDTDGAARRIGRGIVLFLEKKAAHVALIGNDDDGVEVTSAEPVAVQIGMQVRLEDRTLRIPGSLARMTGRAVDPLGAPVDLVYSDPPTETPTAGDRIPIAWGSNTVPGLMTRGPLDEALPTGLLALDCLKPLAFGHRLAVLGPRNSGKTRLMLDIIAKSIRKAKARGQDPPHFVYVSIGKSPARVQQILQFLEQTDALPHTTIVSADERDSLIMQYLAPFTGCAIAEYFMKSSSTNQSVVVYDDLATHTTVVEALVQTMKLPKISQLSLSAHAVLMERSARFIRPTPSSLTTFAIADTPDSSTGEVSEFKERLTSIVDDAIILESTLARQQIYPPIDVLMPGNSIRGPPFQSAAMWKFMNRVRTRINESFQTKECIDLSSKLGLEIEPEDLEVLEFQELVRQFFTQQQLSIITATRKELGVFCLATIEIPMLPPKTGVWDIVDVLETLLEAENPELLHQIATHPYGSPWTEDMEEHLAGFLRRALTDLRARRRQEQQQQQQGNTRVSPAVLLQRLRQRRS